MTKTAFEVNVADATAEIQKAIVANISAAFSERMSFEARERPSNTSIQAKLIVEQRKLTNIGVAGVMFAAEVDTNFVNRSLVEGKRFNIYAVQKVSDLLTGLASGTFRNAVNIAVMKSMFQFRAAGLSFNGVAVLAATSDKVKVESGMKAVLIRHTVSAATASTQGSSTMNALLAIKAVTNTGTAHQPIWELTTAPVVDQLYKLVA